MNSLLDILEEIYSYSTERLRYAEGKNGALMAVTSLIVFRLMDSDGTISESSRPFYYISLAFFSVTILTCLASFIPILNIPKMLRKEKTALEKKYADFDNLLSSITLVHYKPKHYIEVLAKKLNQKDYETTAMDIDFAEHIIVNSKIALFKFKCFHNATICMMVAMIFAIIFKVTNTL